MQRRTMILLLLIQSLLLCSCRFQKKVDFPPYTFTVDTLYPTTPVKHQGKTSNCWAYAVASLFETERIMECNDTLNLSPEYWVRCKYEMQFDAYTRKGEDKIARGGLGHTALFAFRQHGALPLDAYKACYQNKPDYPALLKEIRSLANKSVGQEQLKNILDTHMGVVPDSFPQGGRSFTTATLAQELPACHRQYIELTSFEHRPMNERCLLKLPDDQEKTPFFNIPLDEFIEIMAGALNHGYTFVWDGDVSEASFSMKHGFAFYTEPMVNGLIRYEDFETGETTDDHMMHIVGLAHNQHGERFFIAKNSVGAAGKYKGFIYLSEDYVRMKTVSILVDKECVRTVRPTLVLLGAVLL